MSHVKRLQRLKQTGDALPQASPFATCPYPTQQYAHRGGERNLNPPNGLKTTGEAFPVKREEFSDAQPHSNSLAFGAVGAFCIARLWHFHLKASAGRRELRRLIVEGLYHVTGNGCNRILRK